MINKKNRIIDIEKDHLKGFLSKADEFDWSGSTLVIDVKEGEQKRFNMKYLDEHRAEILSLDNITKAWLEED